MTAVYLRAGGRTATVDIRAAGPWLELVIREEGQVWRIMIPPEQAESLAQVLTEEASRVQEFRRRQARPAGQ